MKEIVRREARTMKRVVVALVVAVAVFGACGGGATSGARGPEMTTSPEGEESGEVENSAPGKASLSECPEYSALVDKLREIDSRVDIGINAGQFANAVGDAKVEYDRIAFGESSHRCVTDVGIPAEDALNDYIDAHNKWTRCIDRYACELESIEDEIRSLWNDATSSLKEIKR